MKPAELRKLSLEQLQEKLDETREELMRYRFQQATGELTDPNKMRIARRLVARIETILNQQKAQA